eukprot:m.369956 g.369956  ORF g.369956 m.369956 type:complete len:73 (+) comp16680_c1_seq28:2756-2974(+)
MRSEKKCKCYGSKTWLIAKHHKYPAYSSDVKQVEHFEIPSKVNWWTVNADTDALVDDEDALKWDSVLQKIPF